MLLGNCIQAVDLYSSGCVLRNGRGPSAMRGGWGGLPGPGGDECHPKLTQWELNCYSKNTSWLRRRHPRGWHGQALPSQPAQPAAGAGQGAQSCCSVNHGHRCACMWQAMPCQRCNLPATAAQPRLTNLTSSSCEPCCRRRRAVPTQVLTTPSLQGSEVQSNNTR